MKKRIAIGSAIAALMTAFTGIALKQGEAYGQRNTVSRSETTKTSITDRWQITTQVPESKPTKTTVVQEKEPVDSTIGDAPKHKDLSEPDTACETTEYIENKPPLTLETIASSEEAKQQTAANESFTPTEYTTEPPKPVQIQLPTPKHGDINERGEMYINGFGWVASEGTNSCEYSAEMYTNGNKIGYFG